PPGFIWLRTNDSTRSRESPSSLGDSLAICSISSLKLTAPPLYLDAKNLADDASQQSLQAGVMQFRQRSDCRFLIGLQQLLATLFHAQDRDQLSDSAGIGGIQRGRRPDLFEKRFVGAPSPIEHFGKRQRRLGTDRPVRREVFEIVANLIRNAQRF